MELEHETFMGYMEDINNNNQSNYKRFGLTEFKPNDDNARAHIKTYESTIEDS